MPNAIHQIALDFDRTFETHQGDKNDGYIETDVALVSISQGAVFPMAPPQIVDTLDDLLKMDTPPVHLRDAPNAVVTFRNDYLPIEHVSVYGDDEDRAKRTRNNALAQTRTFRQQARIDTTAASHGRRSQSAGFYFIALGLGISFPIAILAIVAMKWAQIGTV